MLKIAVLGAGRMGREVVEVLQASDNVTISGVWSHAGGRCGGHPVQTDISNVLADADVAVDFTLASATDAVLAASLATSTPLVSGVSGMSAAQTAALEQLSRELPVLHDRNMSYGIAVLNRLLEQAVPLFSGSFDCEIHETHHVHKLDAPSGTALMLGETVAEARGQALADLMVYDPESDAAPASPGAIRFQVRREGEVPGDHEVRFVNDEESVSLSHSVSNRRVFAAGAVRAAIWLPSRSPGLYRMSDLLLD